MLVVYICAALKISAGTPASCGPSATAGLLVVCLCTDSNGSRDLSLGLETSWGLIFKVLVLVLKQQVLITSWLLLLKKPSRAFSYVGFAASPTHLHSLVIESDRKWVLRFWPKTKPAPKVTFCFRPKSKQKRIFPIIFGRIRKRKRNHK